MYIGEKRGDKQVVVAVVKKKKKIDTHKMNLGM
jgi:hypothetical protein